MWCVNNGSVVYGNTIPCMIDVGFDTEDDIQEKEYIYGKRVKMLIL